MDRMSYQLYEMLHLAFAPARAMTDAILHTIKNPLNPLHHTSLGRSIAASAELFERMTRRYGKPIFGLDDTTVDGVRGRGPRGDRLAEALLRPAAFQRGSSRASAPRQSKLLIVAPMSGHYATLLRGTVEAFLPHL